MFFAMELSVRPEFQYSRLIAPLQTDRGEAMMWPAIARQPQRKERSGNGQIRPEDQAKAAAHQEQVAAAPEEDQDRMEDPVIRFKVSSTVWASSNPPKTTGQTVLEGFVRYRSGRRESGRNCRLWVSYTSKGSVASGSPS